MEAKLVPLARDRTGYSDSAGTESPLDEDLAEPYGVPAKRLNEQVRRNPDRFPEDFMFRLTEDEVVILRSQTATLETSSVLAMDRSTF